MSSHRLGARLPGARAVGRARLRDFRLVFNKRSRDGSGKANLVRDKRATCWGVLWALGRAEDWEALDLHEPGYRRRFSRVIEASGGQLSAQLYLHKPTPHKGNPPEIAPHAWYLAHLLEGAEEHDLPEGWRRHLARIRCRPAR